MSYFRTFQELNKISGISGGVGGLVPGAKYCWSVATVANNILRKIPKEVFKVYMLICKTFKMYKYAVHCHKQNEISTDW